MRRRRSRWLHHRRPRQYSPDLWLMGFVLIFLGTITIGAFLGYLVRH